jgi:cell cycle checkpoint protein
LQLPPILLLTGPAGVGKTATIQALSHDLKFKVQEWINPLTTSNEQSFTDQFSGLFSKFKFLLLQ